MRSSEDGWVAKQEVRRQGWDMEQVSREVNSELEKIRMALETADHPCRRQEQLYLTSSWQCVSLGLKHLPRTPIPVLSCPFYQAGFLLVQLQPASCSSGAACALFSREGVALPPHHLIVAFHVSGCCCSSHLSSPPRICVTQPPENFSCLLDFSRLLVVAPPDFLQQVMAA